MNIRTVGGIIDVSPETIGYNINFAPSVANTEAMQNLGNRTDPGVIPLYGAGVIRPLGQFGGWIKVDDNSVTILKRSFQENVAIWTLPNGTSLSLVPNEDVQFTIPAFQWPFGDTLRVANVYVKFSSRTVPGLAAYGLLPDGYEPPPKTNEPKKESLTGSLGSLAIIAMVGAAIWFLPKNVLKG